jgi:hypothetical protein
MEPKIAISLYDTKHEKINYYHIISSIIILFITSFNQTGIKTAFFSHFSSSCENIFAAFRLHRAHDRSRKTEVHPHRQSKPNHQMFFIIVDRDSSRLFQFCKKSSNSLIWLVRGNLTPVLNCRNDDGKDLFRFRLYIITRTWRHMEGGNFRHVDC